MTIVVGINSILILKQIHSNFVLLNIVQLVAILLLGHLADLIVATEQWGSGGRSHPDVSMKKYLRGPH